MPEYYERLLQVYKRHNGIEDASQQGMPALVSAFVMGLRPDISAQIQLSVMCWQAKAIEEFLVCAHYYSEFLD